MARQYGPPAAVRRTIRSVGGIFLGSSRMARSTSTPSWIHRSISSRNSESQKSTVFWWARP